MLLDTLLILFYYFCDVWIISMTLSRIQQCHLLQSRVLFLFIVPGPSACWAEVLEWRQRYHSSFYALSGSPFCYQLSLSAVRLGAGPDAVLSVVLFFLLPSTKHVDFVTDNNCSCAFWCAMGWMLQILRKVTCIREVLICLYAENFVWEILRSVFTLDNLTFFKIRNSPFKNVYFFMWNWVIFLLEYVLCISFCQWNSLTWYSVNSPLFWKLSKSVIW